MAIGVELNPWLICATLLALRWGLTGLTWVWLLPVVRRPGTVVGRTLAAAAAATLLGFTSTQLWVLLLAEVGGFTPTADWAGIAVLAGGGLGLGLRKPDRLACMRAAWAAVPAVWLLSALIMLAPRQGEWIVGGWDPGTYVVQGGWVSRTGTFRPAPDPLFSDIQVEELPALAPQVLNYMEGMPGFPLDPRTRAFVPFFFRLMPSLTAVLDRCGGLRAATRVNLWAGALAASMLLLFVTVALRDRFTVAAAGLLTLLHPVWLYHLRFPTTELLQQALFFATATLAAVRRETPAARWLMALTLFALVSLHISMALFAALLLAALAWADLDDPDRAGVLRARGLQGAGVLGGVAFNLVSVPVTVERLGAIMIPLLGLAILLLLTALGVDAAGCWPRGRRLAGWGGRLALWGLLAAASLASLLALAGRPERFVLLRGDIRAILPYLSPWLVLAALPGLLAFRKTATTGRVAGRVARAMIFVLVAATGMTLWESAITPLYPWATRRYVAFTLPLLGILAAESLARLRDVIRQRSIGRLASTLALAALVLIPAGRIRRAWCLTEYDGLSTQLAAVALRTERRDVIVADRFRYGIPLRFLHGYAVLNGELLRELTGPDAIRFTTGILHRLHEAGWRIRFLTSTDEGMAVFPFMLHDVWPDWESDTFTLRELRHDVHIRDYVPIRLDRRFALHTWYPSNRDWLDDSPARRPAGEVDIGSLADAWFVVAGFHGREQTDDGSVNVRWTGRQAVLALPRPPAGQGMTIELDYIDRHRPPFPDGERVTLALNGRLIATAIESEDHAHRLSARIPADWFADLDRPRLIVHVPTWSPAAATGGADPRELGVMLDRLRFEAVTDEPPAADGDGS